MAYTIEYQTVLEARKLTLCDDHFLFSASRATGSDHRYAYAQVRAILLCESTGAICFEVDQQVYELPFEVTNHQNLQALEFFINQARASQELGPISLTD